MKQGIAVVAYNCKKLQVLEGCHLEGEYGFMGVAPKEQVIRLESNDEVSLNLPLGTLGATLGGGLERGSTLDVALAMIGRKMSARTWANRSNLEGQCAGATHFVRGATVGAFAVATGTRANVRSAVEVFGIGASAESSQAKSVRNKDGSPEACKGFTPDAKTPPAECSALVQLQLTRLDEKRPDQELQELAAAGCPAGSVLAAGRCTRASGDEPHQCRAGDVAGCKDQCDNGSARSCAILGDMLSRDRWSMRDDRRAATYFDKACGLGDEEGCNGIGVAYLDGRGVAKDEGKGVELLRRACSNGSARGCTSLGYAYTYGKGVAREPERAAGYFDLACRGGQGRACANLGVMLTEGDGVPKELARGVELLERSCKALDGSGCYNFARLLANGIGVPKDIARAVRLYDQSCEAGEGFSCNNLGTMYVNGNGVPKDLARAAQLFERACQIDLGGCVNLGALLNAGKGVPKNPVRAVELFRRACEGGNARGCTELGKAYADGRGVGRDPVQAETYLRKACAQRETAACEKLKELAP